MLGLSRNTWFLIGGVMLVVVLYLGFSGDDNDANEDPSAQANKANKRKGKGKGKGKGKRDKGRSGESGGVGVGKMCAKIDCSEAQLSSFKGMVKEHRKNTASQRRGLAEAHAKIAAELAEDTIDTEALDEAFEDALTHRAEMENSARGVLEAMHAKLSAAQREGLAKLVARHGPSMLLSRPAGAPQKSGNKKSRRKKGKKQRAHPSDRFPTEKSAAAPGDESDPAPAVEFSRAPQAGLSPAAAKEQEPEVDADAADQPAAE